MSLSNIDRFMLMTAGLEAPTVYLKAAWLFSVSAALERRVYFGDPNRPLHANQYVLLVGRAGLGKGLALSEAKRMLDKYNLFSPEEKKKPPGERQPVLDPETHLPRKQFYCLPDATSFEQLAEELANAKTAYVVENGELITCSAAYALLEELSSLLRPRKSEDVARFLLNMYDGKFYAYKTKTAGNSIIDNGCLNFIAGTTPDFFRAAEDAQLIGEGLLSRFFVISTNESDRPAKFHIPKLSPDQLEAQAHLQKWLSFIGGIYGGVEYATPDVHEHLESWWETESRRIALFQDERIEKALARRKVQVIKLAMAYHFSESATMQISRNSFDQAIAFARQVEEGLIQLLRSTGNNTQYTLQRRLIERLRLCSPVPLREVIFFLAPNLDMAGINSVVELSKQSNEILVEGDYVYALDDKRQKICNNPEFLAETNKILMPPKKQ